MSGLVNSFERDCSSQGNAGSLWELMSNVPVTEQSLASMKVKQTGRRCRKDAEHTPIPAAWCHTPGLWSSCCFFFKLWKSWIHPLHVSHFFCFFKESAYFCIAIIYSWTFLNLVCSPGSRKLYFVIWYCVMYNDLRNPWIEMTNYRHTPSAHRLQHAIPLKWGLNLS